MKKVALWGGVVLVVILGLAIVAALQFGQRSPIIASGSVHLSPSLTAAAKGVRTLYITVFDANSPMPMPYGAMRAALEQDAEGLFYEFVLTPERLRVMNPNAPLPTTLRIKARLDRDGRGGRDQTGDLTGEVTNVAAGSSAVKVSIEKEI